MRTKMTMHIVYRLFKFVNVNTTCVKLFTKFRVKGDTLTLVKKVIISTNNFIVGISPRVGAYENRAVTQIGDATEIVSSIVSKKTPQQFLLRFGCAQ